MSQRIKEDFKRNALCFYLFFLESRLNLHTLMQCCHIHANSSQNAPFPPCLSLFRSQTEPNRLDNSSVGSQQHQLTTDLVYPQGAQINTHGQIRESLLMCQGRGVAPVEAVLQKRTSCWSHGPLTARQKHYREPWASISQEQISRSCDHVSCILLITKEQRQTHECL